MSPEKDTLAEALDTVGTEPLCLQDDVVAAHAVEPEWRQILHIWVTVGRCAQQAYSPTSITKSACATLRQTHRHLEDCRHSLANDSNSKLVM